MSGSIKEPVVAEGNCLETIRRADVGETGASWEEGSGGVDGVSCESGAREGNEIDLIDDWVVVGDIEIGGSRILQASTGASVSLDNFIVHSVFGANDSLSWVLLPSNEDIPVKLDDCIYLPNLYIYILIGAAQRYENLVRSILDCREACKLHTCPRL